MFGRAPGLSKRIPHDWREGCLGTLSIIIMSMDNSISTTVQTAVILISRFSVVIQLTFRWVTQDFEEWGIPCDHVVSTIGRNHRPFDDYHFVRLRIVYRGYLSFPLLSAENNISHLQSWKGSMILLVSMMLHSLFGCRKASSGRGWEECSGSRTNVRWSSVELHDKKEMCTGPASSRFSTAWMDFSNICIKLSAAYLACS